MKDVIDFAKSKQAKKLQTQFGNYSIAGLEEAGLSLSKKSSVQGQFLGLLKLRKKAGAKFSLADKMFFNSDSLEVASSEAVSRHIAKRFEGFGLIADLGCGIGSNAIFLANRSKVVAIDRNPDNIIMAKENARVYAVEDNIDFRLGDIFDQIDQHNFEAVFIDPLRKREGKSKTRSIFNSEPSLKEILPKVFLKTKNICIKISPAFDYKELQDLPEEPEVEVVAEDNENKVALLWFGSFKSCQRRATILLDEKSYELKNNDQQTPAKVSQAPGLYLADPSKAITKARLVDELAREIGFKKLHPNISFLTGDSLPNKKDPRYRIYKIKNYDKFSLAKIKQEVRNANLKTARIISRGTPLEVGEIIKKIGIKEGGEHGIFLTKMKDGQNYYIFAEKIIFN